MGTFDAVPHVACQLASATNSSSEELHLASGLRPQLKEGLAWPCCRAASPAACMWEGGRSGCSSRMARPTGEKRTYPGGSWEHKPR